MRNQVEVPLSLAYVLVVRGKFAGKVVRDVELHKGIVADARGLPVSPENAPAPVRPKLHSGDALTRFGAIDPGDVTVCAIGTSGNVADGEYSKRLHARLPELPLTCIPVTVNAADQVVVIDVPPLKRLD